MRDLCLVFVLICITSCYFRFCNILAEEERAGCFTLNVFHLAVSAMCHFFAMLCDGLQCVLLAFPGYTHLSFGMLTVLILKHHRSKFILQ